MKRLAYTIIPLIVVLFACTESAERIAPAVEADGSLDGQTAAAENGSGPHVRFSLAGTEEITTLDPHFVATKAEQTLSRALYEGLFVPDSRTGSGIPALAERWETDETGREYTFYLRKTAWSDGTPVTARTFRDSWLRLLDPETNSPFFRLPSRIIEGAGEFHAGVSGREDVALEAADEYVLRVVMKKPFLPVEEIFSLYYFAPVPVHILEANEENPASAPLPYGSSHVCNGPYFIEERTGDGRIVLSPRPAYRKKSSIGIERVEYQQVSTEKEGYEAFKNGEIDWLIDCRQPVSNPKNEFLQIHPAIATYYYLFQTNRPAVRDPLVRKALALAIDTEKLFDEGTVSADTVAFLPAGGMVPPIWGYQSGVSSNYAPEEARRLLAEAGFPGGKGFPEIVLLLNEAPGHLGIAEAVRRQWRETLGVRAKLEIQKWSHYLISRRAGAYDVARAGWRSDYPDPVSFLEIFTTGSELNDGRYSSSAFDAVVSSAAGTRDPFERKQLCAEAEEMLIEQDSVCIPLFHYASMNLIDTGRWGGWHGNVMDVHLLQDIYLKYRPGDGR
jgi:oligopeptide transport system substrate-binding protein